MPWMNLGLIVITKFYRKQPECITGFSLFWFYAVGNSNRAIEGGLILLIFSPEKHAQHNQYSQLYFECSTVRF